MKKVFLPLFLFISSICFGQDYIPIFEGHDSVRLNVLHWTRVSGERTTDISVIDTKIIIDSVKFRKYAPVEHYRDKEGFFIVREDTLEKKIYIYNEFISSLIQIIDTFVTNRFSAILR